MYFHLAVVPSNLLLFLPSCCCSFHLAVVPSALFITENTNRCLVPFSIRCQHYKMCSLNFISVCLGHIKFTRYTKLKSNLASFPKLYWNVCLLHETELSDLKLNVKYLLPESNCMWQCISEQPSCLQFAAFTSSSTHNIQNGLQPTLPPVFNKNQNIPQSLMNKMWFQCWNAVVTLCVCTANVSGSSLVGKTVIQIEDFCCLPQYLLENGEILHSPDHSRLLSSTFGL